MKKGFKENIEELTLENNNFRKVLYTGMHCQLVLMCLGANEDIGMEVHDENDQFFRFEGGDGMVIVNDTEYSVKDGDAVIVPSGSNHNIIAGNNGLKFYTIYSPAHHKDGILRVTKADAVEHEADFDGVVTEQ